MPNHLPLATMAAEIRARRLSPVEVVEAHLKQIERVNPRLNAFVSVYADEARAAAKQAEAELTTGGDRGPLHGVPLTIKDSFDVAGKPTLCGSRFRIGHKAAEDSSPAARLRAAGAIFLGKTNTPEFLYNWETDNYITGRTNSAWDLERTPGGSSGGEAAAISAFCSAGGMGSDAGGSIRVPAHFSGIAGLKPTPGRVPCAGHFPAIIHPGGLLGVGGPMARSARDVRALFEVVARYDPDDPFSAPVPLREAALDSLRVGVWEQFYDTPVQEPIRSAVRKAARKLSDIGISAEPFHPRGMERVPRVWQFFFGILPARELERMMAGREQEAHWTGTEIMRQALELPEPNVSQILENFAARDAMRASFIRQMAGHRILLWPACGVTAFRHRARVWTVSSGAEEGPEAAPSRSPLGSELRSGDSAEVLTGSRQIGLFEAMMPLYPANLLGLPAIVIPFDMTPEGLPVGIQLVGRPYEEELLLEIAIRLEEARGPFPAPPLA